MLRNDMKEDRKIDRRIRRTRRQLHEALHQLMQERPYDEISVLDIVDEADISRATFYLHYKDKDELLLHNLELLSQQLIDDLQATDGNSLHVIAQMVFQHVEAHRQLYQTLQSNTSASFVIQHQTEHLVDLIKATLITAAPELARSETGSSRVSYQLAGMLMGQILWWLQHDLKPSAATMAQQFHDMGMRGIEGMRD